MGNQSSSYNNREEEASSFYENLGASNQELRSIRSIRTEMQIGVAPTDSAKKRLSAPRQPTILDSLLILPILIIGFGLFGYAILSNWSTLSKERK